MALVIKDRVKETTTTTGTGAITLAGAATNFQTFTSVLSNADTTFYAIIDDTNGAFEVGIGTFASSGTTLTRTTVLESSNSGSAVNLGSGAKQVFMTYPAEKSVFLDASNQLVINGSAVTSTVAELNIIDGGTSATSTTIVDADRVVLNDNGTMVQVAVTDLAAYFDDEITAMPNLVTTAATTVGALNSGSITSGFGSIDNGSSAIATTGTITYGSLSDGSITITAFVDEDNMSSNSATLIPTQQSVKAYVDSQVTAQDLDATTDSGTIDIDLDSETLTIAGGEGIDTSATGTTITITGEEASTSNKGIASFSSTFFSVSSGAVSLVAAQTGITSVLNTSLIIGRDGDNQIKFNTDNQIIFEVDGGDNVIFKTSGEIEATSLDISGAADIDGTITGGALTVDDVAIDGKVITMTGDTNDTVTITAGPNGTLAITTTDTAAAAANITITADGTFEAVGTTITLDSSGDIELEAAADVNIPSGVGLTFGDDGEKIEGDGTDLTISGNNINLTAVADVNIPSGVGLTFATAEKIESDGTDLSITVGSGGDINIPANIGLTFGDDGEKIEGDGSDLTISGNSINLAGNATVTGNFTVNGTTSTLNTTNLVVTDPLVKYGQGYTGTAYDQGFVVTRGDGSSSNTANRAFIWDESADEFVTANTNTEDGTTAGNVTINDYANLHVGKITADDASVFNAITASGILKTDDTTEATTTTDGSLQTDGGLSVVKDAVFGDDVKLLSDATVVSFGAGSDVTLTHVHDTGLILNAAMVIQFRDSAINIGSPADGDLDINADDEIELNSTLIDVNGNLDVSGTIVGASTLSATTGTFSGILKTDDATEATSTTDGSLQTDGGLSVVKDAVFGDDVKLLSDAAVLNFGADSDVTLTHVADTALLLNSSRQLQFGDSGTYIHQSADGVLDLVSDTEVEINGTTIDINGNVDISGTTTQTGVSTSAAKDIFNAGMSVKNGATSAGFIEFFEDSDNGTNKATLIGPSSTSDVTLTLPSSAGTLATTASAADEATALAIALG